jgi:LPS sulfotransferase NodH
MTEEMIREAERLRTRFNTWKHSAFLEDGLTPNEGSRSVLAADVTAVVAFLHKIAPHNATELAVAEHAAAVAYWRRPENRREAIRLGFVQETEDA